MPTLAEEASALPARAKVDAPRLPGAPELWVFILCEMTLFTILFLTYLYYRARDPVDFADSQRTLNQDVGVVFTLLMLASSLFVASAVRATRFGRLVVARRLVTAAIACGAAFVVIKVFDYLEKVHQDLTPAKNYFFMFYFVLTGLHLFHVFLGLAALILLFAIIRHPAISRRGLAWVEGCGSCWHMVDLIWILLFPLLYIVR